VHHSIIDESERVLSAEEFVAMPDEGVVNPFRLRVAQGGINPEFRDGKSLIATEANLKADPEYTLGIPPVEIGIYKNKVYSFDTRRVIVHMRAKELNPKVYIRYKKISGEQLAKRVAAIYSERPWNGLVTAERWGGKNSESKPYINPVYRPQLEGNVSRDFKCFPSERKGTDSNGFPVERKKAKKLYRFFQEKARDGSNFASQIIKEAEVIAKSEGQDSAYRFLISRRGLPVSDSAEAMPEALAGAGIKPTLTKP
jgi:hypothetical protein